MQISVSASGPASGIGAQLEAQIARETARLAKEAADFNEHVVNSVENLKKYGKEGRVVEFPSVAAAGPALEAVRAFALAEIAHVPAGESVSVAVSVTVHRPDPAGAE
jgi:hypothetical protein